MFPNFFSDAFRTKLKIMPVYDENDNQQKAVVVMIKNSCFDYWHPAKKDCFDKHGDLINCNAIFNDEASAKDFISHLTTIL